MAFWDSRVLTQPIGRKGYIQPVLLRRRTLLEVQLLRNRSEEWLGFISCDVHDCALPIWCRRHRNLAARGGRSDIRTMQQGVERGLRLLDRYEWRRAVLELTAVDPLVAEKAASPRKRVIAVRPQAAHPQRSHVGKEY
jgi:hypothetical protein